MKYTKFTRMWKLHIHLKNLHLPFCLPLTAACRIIASMKRKNVLVMVSPMSFPRTEGIARYAREHDWNLMIQDRLGYHPLAWNGDGVIATIRSDPVTFSCIARLLNAALELDISVPEELAILTIGDNRTICENQSVPLSSIDQNLERGGYEAAALLDRLMSGQRPPKKPILVPPLGVVVRRSTEVIAVSDPTVRKAMELISRKLAQPIGSPQIADALGVRRPVLDTLFREHLCHSVGEEIRRQRFARAKLLLETTNMSVAAIAAETGYCSPSHFANTFRDTTGVSPRAWRNQL